MIKYELLLTSQFLKKRSKLIKRNPRLEKDIASVLKKMLINPLDPKLRPHKAEHPSFGRAWSVFVTRYIRIRWDFYQDNKIIVYTIGGHSGKDKVY